MTQAYPLQWPKGWPHTPIERRRHNTHFQTTFDKARRDLLHELELLGAGGIVISSWLPLNRDGSPRSDQARRNIEDPGVAVYFTRKEKQMVMARDAFLTVHDNLRSIGLAIAALRALERHGGGALLERAFHGFAALPPPVREKPWWEVLSIPRESEEFMIEAAYKHRAKAAHPDSGGSDEAMAELNRARAEALKERSGS
ncbi:hypothetical protein [Methylocystis sp. SC2]|uniref:hypothetical protein n=1 Tax=Methylocystis sp. (strain SC2) TaxID=187303 RepID=UPI00027AEF3D|nr:hypothetical protein [Methylocystis sp. SC2]CCJ07043.1 DnaJ domain-containing heat shock protein [Methylocystis sp. SC2]